VAWLFLSILGGVLQGGDGVVTTVLASNVSSTATTIPVLATNGFDGSGTVAIDNEEIYYPKKTSTSFKNGSYNNVVRGYNGTTPAAHIAGASVGTHTTYVISKNVTYTIQTVQQSSGIWAAVTVPLALLKSIKDVIMADFSFMGTDLAIIGYLWLVMSLGLIISLYLALAGSLRV
jgi:hypothetical protein